MDVVPLGHHAGDAAALCFVEVVVSEPCEKIGIAKAVALGRAFHDIRLPKLFIHAIKGVIAGQTAAAVAAAQSHCRIGADPGAADLHGHAVQSRSGPDGLEPRLGCAAPVATVSRVLKTVGPPAETGPSSHRTIATMIPTPVLGDLH